MPPDEPMTTPVVTEPTGFTMPDHGAPAVNTPAEELVQVPVKETIIFGGKVFNSQAEALAYADTQMRSAPTAAVPARQETQDVDPADILFEDPKAALRLQADNIKREMRQQYDQVENNKRIWNNFYSQNKDLQGMDDFVEIAQKKKWNEIKDLPIDQSLAIVAKDARAMIAKIRGGTGTPERMNPNGATTANPSRVNSPTMPTTAAPAKNFVDEMKEMRAKKKKAV